MIKRNAIVIGTNIRLFENLFIDKNLPVANFDFFVGEANDSADEPLRLIAGIIIGHDVTAFKVSDIFCYENPGTLLKGWFHGDACDLNRFGGMLRRSTASNKHGRKDAEEDRKNFGVGVHVISLRIRCEALRGLHSSRP